MKKILIVLSVLINLLSNPSYAEDSRLIRLATTTSTDNSGLLAELLPVFTQDTGYRVHVIAVGTGKALRLGTEGDVDVVLVHAFAAENKFVESGAGEKRFPVMYNDFVVVGAKTDPANMSASASAVAAFQQVSLTQSLFLSRGDNSGTHKKELSLWNQSAIQPAGNWYREVGQGMGKVLQMANELDAYTLTDRGTWIAYRGKSNLKITFEGDEQLFNPYGIIAVNPAKYPDINYAGARALIQWITSAKGQQLIGNFKLRGEPLFTPMANQ